jgi:hypothetical protein
VPVQYSLAESSDPTNLKEEPLVDVLLQPEDENNIVTTYITYGVLVL